MVSNKKQWSIEVATALLVLLWTYAGLSKLLGWSQFLVTLREANPLQYPLPLTAWALIAMEAGIVVLLLLRSWCWLGALFSAMLLVLFTVYISFLFWYLPNMPCSCGGVLQVLGWKAHIVFNLFFLCLSGYLFIQTSNLLRNQA